MLLKSGFRRRFGLSITLSVAFIVGVATLGAHEVSSVSLISNLDTEKKTYLLDAAMEVVPSEDPALNDQISPEDAAREFAAEYLTVLFDEKEQEPSIEIEIVDASDENTPEELQRQQVVVTMKGNIPESAREFLLYLDPSCPMAVVMVVIKDEQPSRRMQVVLAGEYSRPVNVEPILEGDPFEEEEGKGKVTEETEAKESGETNAKPSETDSATSSPAGDSLDETDDGAPELKSGWLSFFDGTCLSLLLLISVFLLTIRSRSVFIQIAILLIVQSISLALAAWEIIPARENAIPVLALMIAAIAVEAVFHRNLKWWRCVLLAAAGWASGWHIALTDPFRMVFLVGEPVSTGKVIQFMFGVELAFIAVGLIAAAVLLLLNRFSWYRQWVVQPLAVLIAALALFQLVDSFL